MVVKKNDVEKPDLHQCPLKPPSIRSFSNNELEKKWRDYHVLALNPSLDFVRLNFRVMRKNHELFTSNLVREHGAKVKQLYMPQWIDYWTEKITLRIHRQVRMGIAFNCFRKRFGLESTGLKFCLDGFFGLTMYGDIFGNVGYPRCPWMELENEGTPSSLKLKSGDNIFVNVADEKMCKLAEDVKRTIAVSTAAAKK